MSSFGKKTKNPGYERYGNWGICDYCGFAIKAAKLKETWDGLLVCPEDWEARHDQDFVRSRKDKIAADVVRPEGADTFLVTLCIDRIAIAEGAVAGCAIANNTTKYQEIPTGTFNTNTL